MSRPVVDRVRKARALRRLPVGAVREVVRNSDIRDEEAGSVLFREGDPGGSVFLIVRGSVKIHKKLDDGRNAQIAVRSGLDWIGELSLKAAETRSATAIVESRTQLLEIRTVRFVALLKAHPEAALDLLHLVSKKLRESDSGLIDSLRKRTDELLTANERLGAQVRRLRANDDPQLQRFVGQSPHAIRIRAAATRAARSTTPVLLSGERGAGKEFLARIIHDASTRAGSPFESFDCSIFSGPIVEAELFGHTRGAFPGARDARPGAVERAGGGSLYLANLEALPHPAQGMLHRFVELGEFQRVGESRVRTAEPRILGSVSVEPAEAIRDHGLREDLAIRLGAMRISLPPLRQRRSDIPVLSMQLAEESAAMRGVAPLHIGPSALHVLSQYDYPDNADELRGEFEWLTAKLEPGSTITSRDLSAKFVQADPSTSEFYTEAVRAFKAQLITNAIVEEGGHRARAAERLGLHPSNLSRMVRDLELDDVL